MITIVDYKMINIGSILNMLKKVGAKNIQITNNPKDIEKASKIIMPGVGSFDHAMSNLEKYNLIDALRHKATIEKVPFLGICLGMQLMTNSSEEGSKKGLSLINATCAKFNPQDNKNFKVPHMGWNRTYPKKKSRFFDDPELNRFYFVHSYYVQCHDSEDTLLTTTFCHDFTSAFEHENLIGVQFHPEKSHKNGLHLFNNFIHKI